MIFTYGDFMTPIRSRLWDMFLNTERGLAKSEKSHFAFDTEIYQPLITPRQSAGLSPFE